MWTFSPSLFFFGFTSHSGSNRSWFPFHKTDTPINTARVLDYSKYPMFTMLTLLQTVVAHSLNEVYIIVNRQRERAN